MKVLLLKQVPILAMRLPEELDRLAALVVVRHLAPGSIAVKEGEPGDVFFVIVSGRAQVITALGTDLVQNRTEGALAWIVENGSAHTGLPVWKGTLSDDEIWQIVSYVRLPKGLDAIAKLIPTPLPTPTLLPTPTPAPKPTSAATSAPSVTPAPVRAMGTMTVTISDYTYVPSPLVVTAGTSVAWVNSADDAPNVLSAVKPPTFESPVIALKGSYDFVFEKAGTYAHACTLHDFMHGTVVVM
jgi:plastocyanin